MQEIRPGAANRIINELRTGRGYLVDKDIWKQDRSSEAEPGGSSQDGAEPRDHQADEADEAASEEQEEAGPRQDAGGGSTDPVPYMEMYYASAEPAASMIRDEAEHTEAAEAELTQPVQGPDAEAETEGFGMADETADEPDEPLYEEDPSIPLIERAEAYAGEAEPETLDDAELSLVIEEMCRSKAEEFHMIGYEHVTPEDIWDCISDKYRKSGVPPLHRIVNDILSLRVTNFMNWLTMSAFKGAHFR